METHKLLTERIFPTLTEEDKKHFNEKSLSDLIKIASAIEPTETEAPVVVGRVFSMEPKGFLQRDQKQWDEKDYSTTDYHPQWFAALDLTKEHNPETPILLIHKWGLDLHNKNSVEIREMKYGYVSESGRVELFYEFIRGKYGIDLNKCPNVFGTEQERERLKYRKTVFDDYSEPPDSALMLDIIRIDKDELKDYQEKIREISREKETLSDITIPIQEETEKLRQKMRELRKPHSDKIDDLVEGFFDESRNSKFCIPLKFPEYFKERRNLQENST